MISSLAPNPVTGPVFFDGEFDASKATRSLASFGIGAASIAAGRAFLLGA